VSEAGSVYMRWAKEHAGARYNLANSGLLGCTAEEFARAAEGTASPASTAPAVTWPGELAINGPNADGYPPLKEAIGALYGVAAEQVVLAQGASGANFLAFSALVEPGDEVLVERPAYEPILAALRFLGARVRRFERRFEAGWRPELDEISSALAAGDARLIVLTNPHNPSGVMLPPAEVAEIGRLAAAAGARVLVDEVYRDVLLEEAPPSHVHLGPQFLAVSSLTKSYGLSGLRCGWVLAPADLARRMLLVNDAMGAVGPFPAEALGAAAFGRLPRLAERARAIVAPNLALVHEFLAAHDEHLECVVPGRSMMVFPRLRREVDARPLHDRLRAHHTSIVPGTFFEAPRHFRLGFGIRTEDLRQGLANLARVLGARPPS
jgi:aspartate/methionine/tyrosine aminotransferase